MVQPVYRFLREKNGVGWILTYACVIDWPFRAVHCSLGRLNYDEVFFELFESSSIQSSYERIEASQFSMVILERETSAQFGKHARRLRRSFLAARFIRLATETTGSESK